MIRIRATTEQDYRTIVAIGNAINPDRIPRTAEDFRDAIRDQPPRAMAQTYVAEEDGEVLGSLWFNKLLYVPHADTWYADIQVHPDRRGRGVGRALYAFLTEALDRHGAQRVIAEVRDDEPDSLRFAVHRGFRETGHGDRPSRLDVSQANTAAGQVAAERLAGEGVTIITESQIDPDGREDFLHRLHRLVNEAHEDIPQSLEWTFMAYDEWLRRREEFAVPQDQVWVAFDGDELVGVAALEEKADRTARSGLLAVARSHRGRGIAQALKYHQVEWARRRGVAYLFTENDVRNAPMLHINTEIGYRALPAQVDLLKEIDRQG